MLDGIDFSNRTDKEDLWDNLQIIAKMTSELSESVDFQTVLTNVASPVPKGSAQTSYEEVMRLLDGKSKTLKMQ